MNHLITAFAALLLAANCALTAIAERPKWAAAESPKRAAFFTDRSLDQEVLVNLPLETDEDGLGAIKVFSSGGSSLPFRLIHKSRATASLLVRTKAHKSGVAGYVYYGGKPAEGEGGGSGDAGLVDPAPVRVEVRRASGLGIPDTWARMLFMFRQPGKTKRVTRRSRLGEISLERDGDSDERKKVLRIGRYLVLVRTYVLFPEDGVYRLALNCKNAGFLFLDGDMAASWPGEHYFGSWRPGSPIFVRAGVHKLEVYNCTTGYPYVHAGWLRPGQEKVAHIPPEALICGAAAKSVRIERQDRSLHAHFMYEVKPSYSFRNHPTVFVPVAFTNTSVNWLSDEMTCRWRFDGAGDVLGPAPTHVFLGVGQHRVKLDVRDNLGYVAEYEEVVDCRLAQPTEYALFAELTSLPAVAYASDRVWPHIDVTGALPENGKVSVEWVTVRKGGKEKEGRREVSPGVEATRVPITQAVVDDLEYIHWSVKHVGVDILSGHVRFLRAPFRELPARVDGSSFYDRNGAQLVLVAHERSGFYSQPPFTKEKPLNRLLCIDDGLAVPGLPHAEQRKVFYRLMLREIKGPDVPRVTYEPLPQRQDERGGYGPLLTLVRTMRLARESDADAIVLSIGLQDVLNATDVAQFERNAAALSDIVSGTLGHPIVWVTPPPYLPDPDSVRPFVVAIRKVADARDIPVADLFTAFHGADEDLSSFFRRGGLALSERGHDLAAHVIVRALSP